MSTDANISVKLAEQQVDIYVTSDGGPESILRTLKKALARGLAANTGPGDVLPLMSEAFLSGYSDRARAHVESSHPPSVQPPFNPAEDGCEWQYTLDFRQRNLTLLTNNFVVHGENVERGTYCKVSPYADLRVIQEKFQADTSEALRRSVESVQAHGIRVLGGDEDPLKYCAPDSEVGPVATASPRVRRGF